jgi:DivIVA domain-containing protein
VPEMRLTPEEIANKSFQVVRGRGYDRSEVDRYLASIADDYSAALREIVTATSGGNTTQDDFAEEIGELLRAARETATRIKEKARTEADQMTAEAESSSRQQLAEAEKRRADLLDRAKVEATRMIETAESRARQLRESSERRKAELAARAQERFASLLKHETDLRQRVVTLENLVAEMRGQLESLEQIDLTDHETILLEDETDEGRGAESEGADRVQVEVPGKRARGERQ